MYYERNPGRPEILLIGWIATQTGVIIPSRKYAKKLENNGVKTETVAFDWRPDASFFGACHCLELMLLFGNWERWRGTGMLGDTPREQWEQKGREVRKAKSSASFPGQHYLRDLSRIQCQTGREDDL